MNRGECGGWDAVIPSNAKKITKPRMSVIVVNITVAATAGSILKYDNIKGIAAPKVPAKIRVKSIAKALIEPNK